jgi:hypothetical protein
MWTVFFSICVGIFIGWNIPQPEWAKSLQNKVVALYKGVDDRAGTKGRGDR